MQSSPTETIGNRNKNKNHNKSMNIITTSNASKYKLWYNQQQSAESLSNSLESQIPPTISIPTIADIEDAQNKRKNSSKAVLHSPTISNLWDVTKKDVLDNILGVKAGLVLKYINKHKMYQMIDCPTPDQLQFCCVKGELSSDEQDQYAVKIIKQVFEQNNYESAAALLTIVEGTLNHYTKSDHQTFERNISLWEESDSEDDNDDEDEEEDDDDEDESDQSQNLEQMDQDQDEPSQNDNEDENDGTNTEDEDEEVFSKDYKWIMRQKEKVYTKIRQNELFAESERDKFMKIIKKSLKLFSNAQPHIATMPANSVYTNYDPTTYDQKAFSLYLNHKSLQNMSPNEVKEAKIIRAYGTQLIVAANFKESVIIPASEIQEHKVDLPSFNHSGFVQLSSADRTFYDQDEDFKKSLGSDVTLEPFDEDKNKKMKQKMEQNFIQNRQFKVIIKGYKLKVDEEEVEEDLEQLSQQPQGPLLPVLICKVDGKGPSKIVRLLNDFVAVEYKWKAQRNIKLKDIKPLLLSKDVAEEMQNQKKDTDFLFEFARNCEQKQKQTFNKLMK